ncbi:MAG: site-2 protease family protein [Sedimentisphaerales bacterium]|nr:site-2 protease family protein [Sedimentisphaerales bacterium]
MDAGLGLMWFGVWIVALTCHEAGHSFAALKLGDPTAYRHGQVSLDPLPHIKREPFGTVILPILSYMFFGWMLGWASAPYDPYWAQRNRRKAAWMALAGPASNLILVILAGLAIRGGMLLGVFKAPETITFEQITEAYTQNWASGVAVFLSIWFSLNVILLVFNLMPLPPLDGSGALVLLLSDSAAERYTRMIQQPGFRIFGLVAAWHLVGLVAGPVRLLAVNILYYPAHSYY